MKSKHSTVEVPLLPDDRYWFQLPNDEFILIDLNPNANGEWVVEHHDSTNEFIAGLQINPEAGTTSTKQVARS